MTKKNEDWRSPEYRRKRMTTEDGMIRIFDPQGNDITEKLGLTPPIKPTHQVGIPRDPKTGRRLDEDRE